jgi:hypothetical protein
MFKFLAQRFRPKLYNVYYVYEPGTYVLKRVVAGRSEYEANREFDAMYAHDCRIRRLPNATVLLER